MIVFSTVVHPYAEFLATLVSQHEGGQEEGHSSRLEYLALGVLEVLSEDRELPPDAESWPVAMITHDIGKLSIPSGLLRKPAKLTRPERVVIETHTTHGMEILLRLAEGLDGRGDPAASIWRIAAEVAGGHHENLDGTGYPLGLKGDEVPLLLRVARTVDVFAALTERRSYREAMTPIAALTVMRNEIGGFDPTVMDALLEALGRLRRTG